MDQTRKVKFGHMDLPQFCEEFAKQQRKNRNRIAPYHLSLNEYFMKNIKPLLKEPMEIDVHIFGSMGGIS